MGHSSSVSTPSWCRRCWPGSPSVDVEFLGFHIFAGSQNLNAEILCEAQRKTVELALALADSAPAPVRYLNLGGGFGIPYFDRDRPLDLGAVGENLARLLADEIRPSLPDARVVIELGRYIVGECGFYVTRVVDDVAAELDDHARLGQRRPDLRPPAGRARFWPIGARSSGSVALEVRDAEAAAEVEVADRRGAASASRSASSTVLRCASQRISALRFCEPGEDVEAEELDVGAASSVSSAGHLLGVDAELLRAAAHPHPRALDLEVGVHAHGHARADAEALADHRDRARPRSRTPSRSSRRPRSPG